MTLAEIAAIGILEGVAIAAAEMTDTPEPQPEWPVFRALERQARRALFDLRGEAASRPAESQISPDNYLVPMNAALAVLKRACALYDGAVAPLAATFSLSAVAGRLEANARDVEAPPDLALALRVLAARLRSQADAYNQPREAVAVTIASETPLAAVTRLMAEVADIGARPPLPHRADAIVP